MSSKWKSSVAASAVAGLVPKLRFPEFRDMAPWNLVPMETVYTFRGNNSLSRDKLNYTNGSVKNIHYGDIHTKFSARFEITRENVPFVNASETEEIRDNSFCDEGDLILADASEDLADIGKCIEIISLNNEKVVSGLHTINARPNKKRSPSVSVAVFFNRSLFDGRYKEKRREQKF